MRHVRPKPYRRSYGYIVKARPRADGLPSILEVNPAAQTVTLSIGAGEEPLVTTTSHDKLLALAEQICQEGVPIVYRTWPHRDFLELVELYRAPSDGWHPQEKKATEAF